MIGEMIMNRLAWVGTVSGLVLALAACGQKTSAVASQGPTSFGTPAQSGDTAQAGGQAVASDPRDAPVPQIDGKPMWAANRKHSAEENAQYQFTKNGGDFGAKTESDYLTKAHDFVTSPPEGVQTLDRPNGDKLIYDAKANIFAVVSKTGAPRTMFKPRDGASYWALQKDREAKRGKPSGSATSTDQG